jgi:hypothetical protein
VGVLRKRAAEPPRVLHFDQDQVVWECNELTACERFPAGTGDLIPGSKMRNCLEATFRRALHTGLQGQQIYDIWKLIVRAYSSAALTRDSDRLIALHGVAMRVKEVLGCQYAAGLFSRNMESQLLWSVIDHKSCSRPAAHVAPSWSRALVVGAVSMLPQWDQCDGTEFGRQFSTTELHEQYLCEILHKDDIGSRNTTSMVSHEALEARCYLSPVYYDSDSETKKRTSIKHELKPDKPENGDSDDLNDSDDWPLQWAGTNYQGRNYGDIRSKVLVSSMKGD